MNQSPTTQGSLSRMATKAVRGLIPLLLLVSISGIGAQRKGAKPTSAPLGASATVGATGTIRGRVLDSANGEAMIGVTAVIKDLGVYGITDIDGNYVITNVPVGEQTVTYQITGYQPSATKVNVGTGKAAVANVTLNYKVSSEVVVTAKRVDNTAASLLSKQKKAAAAQDAISTEQISKSPDADAADAAKRVTGVSVVGGRYVFIRGLSERYSVVHVNGAIVPSPVPSKKVVPLDVFPVGLLDNMIISKTYLPSMPADFGAGLIQLNTRDYPEEREAAASIGIGGNSITTFKEFASYNGGKLGFFGYDDGTRALPSLIRADTPVFNSTYSAADYAQIAKDFSNTWEGSSGQQGLPAGKVSGSYGNTFDLGENRALGVYFSAFFSQSSQNIVGGQFYRYKTDGTDVVNYKYSESTYSTSKSVQGTLAYKFSKNQKIRYSSFYTHQSNDTTRLNTGRYDSSASGFKSSKSILNYNETTVLFNQLSGDHLTNLLTEGDKFNWTATHAYTFRNQPDTRTARRNDTGELDPAKPFTRYFNRHDEQSIQVTPEYTLPFFQWTGLKSNLTLGGDVLYKFRDNTSRRFNVLFNNTAGVDLTGPASTVAQQAGLQIQETTGTSLATGIDAYDGNLFSTGGHATLDMPIVSGLRFVSGVRVEDWVQNVAGYNQFAKNNPKERYPATIKGLEILPSANLIWSWNDQNNVRLTYARSINRPDFIESANYRYFDDLETGAVIKGNPNVTKASIAHYDLRWEFFPSASEVIALSGFAKDIQNPIEATVESVGTDLVFTFQNQKRALLYGGEIEFRKKLDFITEHLKYFSIITNLTLVKSQIELNATTTETEKNRALQGMSPYIVNVGLFFDQEKWGTSATVLYNTFGRRIVNVGTNGLANVYEESYGTLDATIGQKLFEKSEVKLTLANLLDPEISQNQGTGDTAKPIMRYRRGIYFGLSYGVKF
jgi:outer membrane receptor for ferrienterochelin and colicin